MFHEGLGLLAEGVAGAGAGAQQLGLGLASGLYRLTGHLAVDLALALWSFDA